MPTCASCGNQIADSNAAFCPQCGARLSPAGATPAGPTTYPPPDTAAVPTTAVVPTTNGLAIVSLVCGFLFFIFPAAVAAILFGHIARSDIRRSGGRKSGAGMALAGLVLGYIGIAMIPIILIVAAIAIPNLLRARVAANEASTIGYLRVLNFAITRYSNANGKYPDTLAEISPGFSSPRKFGYFIEYHPATMDVDGVKITGYSITATPLGPRAGGRRHFFTDQTDVVRAERGFPATANSPPIG
jgi:type II secretory pathway pseudopilin PulG